MSDALTLQRLVAELSGKPEREVSLTASPTRYGLDSLSLLVLREKCEQAFGVVIPDDDWVRMVRLSEILSFVESHRPEAKGTSEAAARVGDVSGALLDWGPEYMAERIEVGMPLTGINHLSENALLKYVGDLRWRHMSKASGARSRDMADDSGNRLYATFFYVDLQFPRNRPMASFGENDALIAADVMERFGSSILDGVTFFIPDGDSVSTPPRTMADAMALGVPAVRLANIFVSMFDGAQWLKKGRPRADLIENIPEGRSAPDSTVIAKEAEANGYVELPDVSFAELAESAAPFEYQIQADRDVNGAGLLYFANYPLFLDLAERALLTGPECGWPDEQVNGRTLLRRRICYSNNASWKDKLYVTTRLWVKRSTETATGTEGTELFSVQQMFRKSDDRRVCISSARKVLFG